MSLRLQVQHCPRVTVRFYTNSARVVWKKDKFQDPQPDKVVESEDKKRLLQSTTSTASLLSDHDIIPHQEQAQTSLSSTRTDKTPVSNSTLSTIPWLGHRQIPFVLERLVEAGPFDDPSFQKVLNRAHMILDSFDPRDMVILVNGLLKAGSYGVVERSQNSFQVNEDSGMGKRGVMEDGGDSDGIAAGIQKSKFGMSVTPRKGVDLRKRSAVRVAAADQFLTKLLSQKMPILIKKNFLRTDLGRCYKRGMPISAKAGDEDNAENILDHPLNQAFLRIQGKKRFRDICGFVEIFNVVWEAEGRRMVHNKKNWRHLPTLQLLRDVVEMHATEFDAAQTAFLLNPGSFLHDVAIFQESASVATDETGTPASDESSETLTRRGRKTRSPSNSLSTSTNSTSLLSTSTLMHFDILLNLEKSRTADDLALLCTTAANFVEMKYEQTNISLADERSSGLCEIVLKKFRSIPEQERLVRLISMADAASVGKILNAMGRLVVATGLRKESTCASIHAEELYSLLLDRVVVPLLIPRLAVLGEHAISEEGKKQGMGVAFAATATGGRTNASTNDQNPTSRLSTKQLATLFRGAAVIDRVLSSSSSVENPKNTNNTNDLLQLKQAICRLINITDLRYQKAQLSVIWRAGQTMGLLLQKMPSDERIVVEELRRGLCGTGGEQGKS